MKISQNKIRISIPGLVIFFLVLVEAVGTSPAFAAPLAPQRTRSNEEGSGLLKFALKTVQTTNLDEPLKIGESVERSIKSEETKRFSIELRSKQVLRIDLTEKGIDVTVGIYLNDRDRELVISEFNFSKGYGRERCSLIVERSGKYTVRIKASESASAGSYQFTSSLKDEATENDRKESEAQKLLIAGYGSSSVVDAIKKWKDAKAKWTDLGDAYWSGYAGNLLGVLCNAVGRNQEALEFYEQALLSMMSAADLSGQSQILANTGKVYSDFGNKPKALNYYKQALALDQQTGDLIGQSITLNNIGSVLTDIRRGRTAEVNRAFRRACGLSPRLILSLAAIQSGSAFSLRQSRASLVSLRSL